MSLSPESNVKRPRASHIWARDEADFYVEPPWVSARLFDVESFNGAIHDPAAGLGRVIHAARAHGYSATGADIVSRNAEFAAADFLETTHPVDNVVTNPPFGLTRQFAERAVALARHKVALLFPVARLNAAGKWL